MMDLTVINHNNQLVVDSRGVAEMIEKRHDHLLRDIKTYVDVLLTTPNLGALDFFIESTYKDSKGEIRPCYLLTKKGCDMVANKMTGEKGILFTATYINKFYEMEQQLKNPLIDDFERRKEIAEMINSCEESRLPHIIQLFKGYFNNPSIEQKPEKKQYSHVGEQDVVALFKKIIREEMENQDNSVRGLARKAEVSPALVSSYLSGKRSPGIVGADQVLKALGLTLVLGKES